MRIFIALAVLLAAALVGLIVHKANSRRPSAPATGSLATAVAVATIAVGDRTDIDAAIPRDGYTVVEFTADF